jgi:YVTN family beta-propeller protein
MNGLKFHPSVGRAPLICLLAAAMACVLAAGGQQGSQSTNEIVGRLDANRFSTPVNQILTPAGLQVDLPDLRPHALALSPDAVLLVVAGATHELVVVDPANGVIREHVFLPSDLQKIPPPDDDKLGQISYAGLAFSPDGSRIYLSNVKGSVEVFTVNRAGHIAGLFSIPLPPVAGLKRTEEIPSGIAISPDGKKLYVCGNLSNRLLELDAGTGAVLRTWNVGVAPYDVVLAGGKAFVSNWGGRRPDTASVTGPAGQGTRVRVDAVRSIANEGSISIVNLSNGIIVGDAATDGSEILVGLHPSALALTPDGRYIVAANAGSDTLSVIDTQTGKIIETIWTRQNPGDLFGAQPNALTFNKTGSRLFVCNGTQNAVAVVDFKPGKSRLAGLIPTGWFPGAIAYDGRRHSLYVANIKGLSPGRPRKSNGKTEYNSRLFDGSLSLIQEPSTHDLAGYTRAAVANMRYPLLRQAALPPRPGQPARPVPERVGEPSVFQHVVYIIKENRSFDQVLGDVKEGNGDHELCVFGENITPNQHKMVRDFVLLDNTYCSGILSADGHQWADSGIVTDYLEKSFSEFPRSYPDGMEDNDVDALAYSPAGFIWDNALSHGRTLRDYGEFAITRKRWKDPQRRGEPRFLDHYREFLNGTDTIALWSEPGIESLRSYMDTDTVGWDLNVPDVFRAAQFVKELKEFERTGSFPNLVIICLPDDHTSGTKAGSPTPTAQVADNDLAFGQIVEALSHSRFWRDTCIFAIEDDPQAGWDHVSSYRTTAYVLSAYTQRDKVIHTQYNQTSLLRTIELILGLPPMNQLDATATPMSDCFMDAPDMTPFVSLRNNVPLDQLNPRPERISDPALRRDAVTSARLHLARADQCPEDTLNRILWRAMRGTKLPYPVWAIQAVDDDKRHD